MNNKRDIWSYDETLTLINILKEKKVLKIMDNKRFRIAEIFQSLEQDMKNKGYCRSATQIHIKFKALKRNYNNCRTALSKSGAGVMKKCILYDELHELFGCRPVNIQEGMDSLNTTFIPIDVNMFDNIPDADGAIPGCSTSDETNAYSNESDNQFNNTPKSIISSISESDSIDYIAENSDLITDKRVEQQFETIINNEITNNNNNNNDVAMLLESDKNRDSKKKFKSVRSTNRQTFAQVFDNCVQKLIKSNEDINRVAIETQNTMINNILKQQEKMLQQQTQLLMQNLHANTLQSQVPINYFSNPTQFRSPLAPLQSFNNPRFVKVPLNVVQSSERCLPVITSPFTQTPLSSIEPSSTSSSISTISSITSSCNSNSASTSNQATK